MASLKKFISLSQASKISGYTQDYLGYLIRQGEIKGVKKSRVWLTTEEEIRNYIFKRKIEKNDLAINDFLSLNRTKRNVVITTFIILFVGILIYVSYSDKRGNDNSSIIKSGVISDGEGVRAESSK